MKILNKKFALSLFVGMLSLSAFSFEDVSNAFTFGRSNVMSGNLSGSQLQLKRKATSEADRYYDFKCTKSGFLKKNHLVFKVVLQDSKDVILQAEADVENCGELLKSIYRVAFEKDESVTIALTETTNDKDIYGLSVSYSKSVPVQNK